MSWKNNPKWIEKFDHTGNMAFVHIAIIAALMVGATILVYATGGIKYVFSHSIYVPVVYAGIIFGLRGGLLAGVAAGLLLGPFMPINTHTGEMQTAVNWLYRMGFLCLIGVITGTAFQVVRAQVNQLSWYALHDVFSGLKNRHALYQNIQRLREKNPEAHFCLAIMNIDNFSQIANTLGLEKTEELIGVINKTMQDRYAEIDTLYHIQRDGFAFLLQMTDEATYAASLGKILDAFIPSFHLGDIPVYVDISAGVACSPVNGFDARELVQKARTALFCGSSRDERLAFYAEEMNDKAYDNLVILGEIPSAIETDQFHLHYQPKIDIASGKAIGVEALLRWQHPQRGNIPPFNFIPQVEKTGLINPLTRYVIRAALKQLTLWSKRGLSASMAINISARNLAEPAILEFLAEEIAATDVKPELIELEITESAIMADIVAAKRQIMAVHELGVRISMDDFGTGHSSMAYLKELPIDYLKIDQAFVRNLSTQPKDRAIVQTAIELSHALDIKCVAEGVEDLQSLEILREYGCDIAQGYYFSKPVPPAEAETFFFKPAVAATLKA